MFCSKLIWKNLEVCWVLSQLQIILMLFTANIWFLLIDMDNVKKTQMKINQNSITKKISKVHYKIIYTIIFWHPFLWRHFPDSSSCNCFYKLWMLWILLFISGHQSSRKYSNTYLILGLGEEMASSHFNYY